MARPYSMDSHERVVRAVEETMGLGRVMPFTVEERPTALHTHAKSTPLALGLE
jgi:hypothetical protein